MLTVNIHDAKTQLSKLVEQAAQGEAFIIAKAGKPMVKVVPLGKAEAGTANRLGFKRRRNLDSLGNYSNTVPD